MKIVHFVYKGKFAHFLQAEYSASAATYLFPPRTVLLGLVGAILGLEKDTPQTELKESNFAISGKIPQTHWHSANLRKVPPASLDPVIKANAKGSSPDERNTIIAQQWLVDPQYEIWASLPDPWHEQFVDRLKRKAWYFCPSMGLSEMIADLEYQKETQAVSLAFGTYPISCIAGQENGKVDVHQASQEELHLKLFRMPSTVTKQRVFSHAFYWMEKDNKPIPMQTEKAWKIDDRYFVFL